jgi:hypothetical protein
MNSTKLRPKTKFMVRRCFARSRLEPEYLVKSYELVVPIYGMNFLQQRDLHGDGVEKTNHRERKGA